MARIICIDYGGKRCGLAVTDPLQIIATALTTVDTKELFTFLADYFSKESVELILIGEPLNLDNTPTDATPLVQKAIIDLGKKFPNIPIQTVDERYSSKNAVRAMVEMGMKKNDRRDKKTIDRLAATMLLQEYLSNRS
ncbi:MAG: Holliday junction resolvase RuvX [Chitinophagia bacterium]|nr:Holliday junction resolvase RuvX [Chitinophagia bacterium]NCA30856.1 Holliday junction resolvase RuvX [Chitinophagia bacterium]NDD16521.1 Holliday junction resolvase RuvX [Chitinophagia bacterium]